MQTYRWIVVVMVMAFLSTVSTVSDVWSKTNYISDQLIVSLRELPQNSAKPIVYLKTDTPLEVLEVGEEFSKVKTEKGEIGYVQKSYLTENLPRTTIIKRLTQENENLNGRILELEKRYNEAFSKGDESQKKILAELQESRGLVDNLQKDLQEANKALSEITKSHEELMVNAKNVVAITDERNQLRGSNETLSATVSNLEAENKKLLKKETIQWFLTGAGVLLLGWVLGKFSKSRRKGSLY